MLFRTALVCAATAAAVFAPGPGNAANIDVDVGEPEDQFSKLSVMAKAGDVINFKFHSSSHNIFITKGFEKDDACTPMEGALHLPIQDDGTEYQLRVNSTNPVYLACGPHCKSNGMVMVINPPNDTVPMTFQANAKMSNPPPPPGMSSAGEAPGGMNASAVMPLGAGSTNGSMPATTNSSSAKSSTKKSGAATLQIPSLSMAAVVAAVLGASISFSL